MKKKTCFIMIFMLAFFSFSLIPKLNSTDQPSPEELKIHELEKQVAEINTMFNVNARKYVATYLELTNLYLQTNQNDKAYDTLKNALRLDSGDFNSQKLMAELEIKKGLYDDAFQRLTYIKKKLEPLYEIYQASDALAKEINDKITADQDDLEKPTLFSHTLVIAKYPGVDDIIFKAICSRVEQEFGLTIQPEYLEISEDPTNIRDKHLDYYERMVQDIIKKNNEADIKCILEKLGLKNEDLKVKEGKERFLREIYCQKPEGAKYWNDLQTSIKDQYDASILNQQLQNKFQELAIQQKNLIGVLAVTNEDIYYGEKNNFLFGLAQGKYAVMSIQRFFTPDTEYTVKLKRSVMQAFSSVGFIIGIPRCTTIICARAYPNSLAEHDRKEDRLCHECLRNLKETYDQLKKKS